MVEQPAIADDEKQSYPSALRHHRIPLHEATDHRRCPSTGQHPCTRQLQDQLERGPARRDARSFVDNLMRALTNRPVDALGLEGPSSHRLAGDFVAAVTRRTRLGAGLQSAD
jgi:hypothetical protein